MADHSEEIHDLRAVAERLDRVAPTIEPDQVMRGRPTNGGRNRAPLAVAVAGVAVVLIGIVAWLQTDSSQSDVATDGTRTPSTTLAPARELYGVGVSAIDDELWVFGGVSGPDGSSPPSTSMLPDQWGPNDLVIVYGADGQVRAQYRLPGASDRVLNGGQVVASGNERYLVSSFCNDMVSGVGCSDTYEPVLFRFDIDQETAHQVPLSLPVRDPTDEIGPGFLHVLGVDDSGLVWVTQRTPSTSALPVSPARLLGIDPTSGDGTSVPLPEGHFELGAFCLRESTVHATRADLGGSELSGISLLRRPATTAEGDWEVVAEPTLDLTNVHGGSLSCLNTGEVVVELARSPTVDLITFSSELGALTEPLTVLGRSFRLVGQVDGAAVLTGLAERDNDREEDQVFLVWTEGAWSESDTTLSRGARPVVLDGALRDAAPLLTSTRPSTGPLAPIEL